MLQKITGLSKNQLFLNNYILTDFQKKQFSEYKKRFLSGEPIEYIIKNAEFYGFDFYVDSRVLIPRNDTEIMIEKIVNSEKGIVNSNVILIDIGTGSACIPISILKNLSTKGFSPLRTYAIDISEDALEVAKINIKKHNLENKIELIQSDLLNPSILNSFPLVGERGCNIVITANLPYIKNGDFKNMDEETIVFEPNLALYGGKKTGFELYEKLIFQIISIEDFNTLNSNKKENIILFIEIGFDQKQIVIDFLEKQNLKFEIFKDNGGIERCIKIYF